MTRRVMWLAIAVTAVGSLVFASLGAARPEAAKADKVSVQLKWVTQAQFAGFYAAAAKGYYKQFNLDVTIKPGGPDITPEQVVASSQAEFGLDWLPSLLATRDQGSDLVNIAQVYTRSGMTELTWKTSGINTIAKMKGKKVGVWCCGNENELFAAAKELRAPYELVKEVAELGKLPVVLFSAGGVATPADAALMRQLGAEGVFVGSGIFKSGDPAKRAAAIVKATTFYDDPKIIADASRNLGEAMVGINCDTLPEAERYANRGW